MKDIYSLTLLDLEEYLVSINQNKAKAKIIYKAIYRDKISSFDDLTSLNQEFINKLNQDFYMSLPKCVKFTEDEQVKKILFNLNDDKMIEAVLMHQKYGNSVCVSTQVGCNMACAFCESGKHKKERNLTAGEMVAQLLYIIKTLNQPVSTIAIMGIGEPFDNYDEVMKFIDIVSSDYGLSIGSTKITVSTCGVVPKIIEYAKNEKINSLAISLHAPNDIIRSEIMPINKAYNLETLISSLQFYNQQTNKKIFIEYVMLKGINDSLENAKELAVLLKDLKCTVNLIGYNETNTLDFKRTDFEDIMKFYDVLKQNNIHATIRRELGSQVKAACGQLKSEYKDI